MWFVDQWPPKYSNWTLIDFLEQFADNKSHFERLFWIYEVLVIIGPLCSNVATYPLLNKELHCLTKIALITLILGYLHMKTLDKWCRILMTLLILLRHNNCPYFAVLFITKNFLYGYSFLDLYVFKLWWKSEVSFIQESNSSILGQYADKWTYI